MRRAARVNIHDKKWWAKKIMQDVEFGVKKTPTVVQMARDALRMSA